MSWSRPKNQLYSGGYDPALTAILRNRDLEASTLDNTAALNRSWYKAAVVAFLGQAIPWLLLAFLVLSIIEPEASPQRSEESLLGGRQGLSYRPQTQLFGPSDVEQGLFKSRVVQTRSNFEGQ